LVGWTFEPSTNDYEYEIGTITADEVYTSSNSVYIGDVQLTAHQGGLRVPKLHVETTPPNDPPGKARFRNNDILFETPNYGVVYTTTNSQQWLTWIDGDGLLQTTQVAASPEISFEERVSRMRTEERRRQNTRGRWNANGQLQQRIEVIEQLLGLRELEPAE